MELWGGEEGPLEYSSKYYLCMHVKKLPKAREKNTHKSKRN